MSDKPTYTLTEAKLKIAKDECARKGHDYEILSLLGKDGPDGILCARCGRSWQIGKENTLDPRAQ